MAVDQAVIIAVKISIAIMGGLSAAWLNRVALKEAGAARNHNTITATAAGGDAWGWLGTHGNAPCWKWAFTNAAGGKGGKLPRGEVKREVIYIAPRNPSRFWLRR
ncbi:MAG: hypothetical protein KGH75_04935 [Rhodospirillales bacterium]|nr:hypothetical protein [Rhodospirillales bacterium]